MITIPALTNAIHVNLPRTVNTTPPEQQKAITVTVDTVGAIYFDDVLVAPEALEERLRSHPRDPGRSGAATSRADERVPYGSVAKVMAAIEHSGISKVSVLTDTN